MGRIRWSILVVAASIALGGCAASNAPPGLAAISAPMEQPVFVSQNEFDVGYPAVGVRRFVLDKLNRFGAQYTNSTQNGAVVIITGLLREPDQPGIARAFATSFKFTITARTPKCTKVYVQHDTQSKGAGEGGFHHSLNYPYPWTPILFTYIQNQLSRKPC